VDLLSLDYEGYHDTTPCFFGSNYEVMEVLKTYEKHKNEIKG
jgi:fructose-1,6-bisphosphatase I